MGVKEKVIRLLYYLPMEMTKIDENIQTAQNLLSGIVERCYELEEENKKLKEKIERWEKCFKKGGFNPQDVECLMEEDTLQELKDLGEI